MAIRLAQDDKPSILIFLAGHTTAALLCRLVSFNPRLSGFVCSFVLLLTKIAVLQ